MIAAGFLPACTAAWHRGAWMLVAQGWWSDLPGASQWPPLVWLAVPAALVTATAIVAAVNSRVRALLVVAGLSSFVSPWMIGALAPLFLLVKARPALADVRSALAAGALLWFAGLAVSPACREPQLTAVTLAQQSGTWWAIVGLSGAALVAMDAIFSTAARRAQSIAILAFAVSAVFMASGRAPDLTMPLGVGAAILWWRVAAGGALVVRWQATRLARAGAFLLVALVPVMAVAKSGMPIPLADEPATADAWQALETAGAPAAVMATGARVDTAVTVWRSGPSEAQQSLLMLAPDADAAAEYMATRAIYAWSGAARRLAMRGVLVAPVPDAGHAQPLLWRVLQFERCSPLSPKWIDVGAATRGGQISGVFPVVEPGRGALLYLSSSRPLSPQAMDWPPESMQGLLVQPFDLRDAAQSAELGAALERDRLAAAALGGARFVTRLRFDRRGTAPDTMALGLGGLPTAAWARLYSGDDSRPDRRPSLCRSSVGQPITAYAGAPAVLDFDIASPQATGGGWYGAERGNTGAFRWGSDDADLLFIAQRPQPLVLRIDAQPGPADWAAADLRVTLNGTPATCREGTPPCDWMLPAEAMRTGLNVITLHTNAVPAPPPDPRRLGLMLRAAQLLRP